MEKSEMEDVLDALSRINRSLDERFEKNADLYIAPDQVEHLKQLIYKGSYQLLVKEFNLKKYSAKVLANVLIKNAWLMRYSRYDLLEPIFLNCDIRYLYSVMKDGVFDNKIDMPPEFRLQLITIFLEKGDSRMCRQMLEQKLSLLNHPQLKAICVKQALKDEPILIRYQLFNDYVNENKNVLTQESIVAQLFPAKDFTDDLLKHIFEEQIKSSTSMSRFWTNRLTVKNIPYIMEQFKKYCRLNSSNLSEVKDVLSRLYPIAKNDFNTFADKFAEACTFMDGDKKAGLAESCISRISDGDNEQILKNALSQYGINAERGELADLEKIIEILNIGGRRYSKAEGYLAVSFDKKYYSDCYNKLKEIYQEVPDSIFEEFCLKLVKSKSWHLKYLLYVIKELVPDDADKNDPLVRQLLKHIQDKDILRKYRLDRNLRPIINFVREKDFDLFTKLRSF